MIAPDAVAGAAVAVLLACLVLVPGVVLTLRRFDVVGILLGFLGAAIATSGAALLAAVTRTPTVPWLAAAVPAVYLTAIVRTVAAKPATKTTHEGDAFSFAGLAAVACTSAIILARAPVKWDARSIWFFHSSWFADRATVYVDLASSYFFGHGDYPPFAASFGAFAWFFGSDRNDWIPQFATGVLVLAACSLLAILIARGATKSAASAVMGGVAMLAILGVIESRGLDGYMDGLLAPLIAVLAISAFRSWDTQIVVIAALAAALTKNEGLLFVLAVILPTYVFTRRRVWLLVPGLAAGIAWVVAVRSAGPDLESWVLQNAMPWSADFLDRFVTIASDLLSYGTLQAAALVWIGALIAVRSFRSNRATLRVLIGMGLVALALFAIITVTYLATPHGLAWHLETSASRLIMHPAMVLVAGGLVASYDVINRHLGGRSDHNEPAKASASA